MPKFTHLHVHSHYSLLDGLPKIDQLLDYVKSSGMDSVALTDHGALYGAVEFYQKAIQKGIKPIIGAEMYIAFESMTQERPNIDDKKYHLVLLVKNEKGYKNLVKLLTKAHLEGFYYKPRIDHNLLKEYSEGLIALSACVKGKIPQLILANKIEEAEKTALFYKEIFGKENFYLEVQHHPHLMDQKKVNKALFSLSKKLKIPLVATNDVHYLKPEDAEAQDVLMLINTGADASDKERATLKADDFSLRRPEEMIEDFKEFPGAVENTQKIVTDCNFQFDLGKTRLPKFETEGGKTPDEYLKELCYQGIKNRYGENPKKTAFDRLDYELSVISQTKFASYFLIVQDFVNWAKNNRIVVGPGRGCLLPDTKILMSDGRQKEIQEIQIGDVVISQDGKKRKVVNAFNYDVEERTAVINSKMPAFKKIGLTEDHKVLSVRHQMCPVMSEEKRTICKPTCRRSCKNKLWKNYKLEWIEAKDLEKNDLLVYPITPGHNSKKFTFDLLKFDKNLKGDDEYVWYEVGTNKLIQKKIKRYINLNKELSRLLGFYIAEGWSRTRKKYREGTIGFGFHKSEKENMKEVKILLKEIFGLESSITLHKTKNSAQVYSYSQIVAKFVEKLCGKGGKNKHIPHQIFECSDKLVRSLLTTLFKGDGSHKDSMRISFDSISLNLVSQVKMLLARLGIMSSTTRALAKGEDERSSSTKIRKPKKRNWHTSFKLTVSGRQLFKFNQLFPEFQIPIKKQKFYRNDTFILGNHIYFPIKSVEYKNYKGRVYDFAVEKESSYVANDVIVHNSAAGSLASFVLGITNVDPLKYNLLFERFLTPDRSSGLPDIDLDFTDRRRNEVINYVAEKYGKNKVAQIITFGTMAARAALRDVGRALGYPYSYCDKVAKMIPFGLTLDQTLSQVAEFRQIYLQDSQAKKLIDFAKKLEGCARHASTHACGVVISEEPLDNICPLQHPTQDEKTIVTQYEMHAIESLGLLKMDFLGLKNLTIIEDTLSRIYVVQNKKIDIENLPLDDKATFKLLQNGETIGVFQLESDGMRRYLKQLKPTELEDIIAMVALYRPGPMQLIPDYIAGKHKKKRVEYLHPKLKPILESTYGIAVYQEQIMEIAKELAGFTLPEADVLRKAIGKKIRKLLLSQKEKFIEGARKNGIEQNIALKIWYWIEPFASYSFNRSHAAAYATIAYQTAYLKARFPVEFMASLLTSEKADVERIGFLIAECKKMGIDVLPPDINESLENFTVVPGQNKIRFGLTAIKNVGWNVVEEIVKERKGSYQYQSIADFVSRINSKDLNKKSMESLIKAGVFDKLAERNHLLFNLEKLLEHARDTQKNKANGQKGLFEGMKSNNNFSFSVTTAASKSEKLTWEKELLGLFITSHPLEGFGKIFEKKTIPIAKIPNIPVSRKVKVGGIISAIKKVITKVGKPMLFLKLEDLTDKIEVIAFPGVIEKNPTVFQENKIVFVWGRVDNRDGVPKIICEEIEEITEET